MVQPAERRHATVYRWNCCSISRGCFWLCPPSGCGGMPELRRRPAGSPRCNACWRSGACWLCSSPWSRPPTIFAPCALRWKSRPPANAASGHPATRTRLLPDRRFNPRLLHTRRPQSCVSRAGISRQRLCFPLRHLLHHFARFAVLLNPSVGRQHRPNR
jgi:hypothetical protein